MKKFTLLLLCAVLLLTCAFALSGCGETYLVSCDIGDGETEDETEFYTAKLRWKDLPEATLNGYDFEGWYLDDAYETKLTEDDLPRKLTTGISLYANWTRKEGWFIVTFNVNDGTTIDSLLTNGNLAEEVAATTRTGYTLEGWYTDADFVEGSKITFPYTPTEDVTINARWVVTDVTMTFETNGGSTIAPVTKSYDISTTTPTAPTFEAPEEPTREGYEFLGWYIDEELLSSYYFLTAVSESLTVYAKWQTTSNLLEMELVDNTHYVVKGIGTDESTDIVIPSTYEGKPVTEIAEKAFYNNKTIKIVVVPSSVTKIGESAFGGCTSLTKLYIPFVGETDTATGAASLFGYIFSTEENYGDRTVQYYGNGSNDYAIYYIPSSLSEVKITNDTGIPQGAFYNCADLRFVYLNEGVVSIGVKAFAFASGMGVSNIPDSVTTIAEKAYYSCASLATLTINDTSLLDSLAKECFAYCIVLSEVNLSDTVTAIPDKAFEGCYLLKTVDVTGTLTIGANAFYKCYALTDYNISSVTSLGKQAFAYCVSLEDVVLPASLTTLGDSVYAYSSITSVEFTDGIAITAIPTGMFEGCHYLTTVNYNTNTTITKVGAKAFYECRKLTALPVLANMTTLENSAFEGCTGIAEIDLRSAIFASLTTLGENIFAGCTYLTDVTLPNSVTAIPAGAFMACTHLDTISFGNAVSSIGNSAFESCTSLTSFAMPAGVTVISQDMFYGCTSLTTFDYGTSVITAINQGAFSGCTALTSFVVADTITSIGDNAFYGCAALHNVEISTTSILDTIGESAFYGCTKLALIKIIPDSVTTVGENAFTNCSILKIMTEAAQDNASFAGWYENWTSFNSTTTSTSVYYGINTSTVTNENGVDYVLCTASDNSKFATALTYNGSATRLDIPATVDFTANNDVPVTTISANAFYYSTTIRNLRIGTSVTDIETYAFYYCPALTSVYIPESVTTIGDDAFSTCAKLAKFYVGAAETADFTGWYSTWKTGTGVTRIAYYSVGTAQDATHSNVLYTDANDVEYIIAADDTVTVVNYAGEAAQITIPATITVGVDSYDVTILGEYIFYNNSVLTHLEISEGITTIKSATLTGISTITSMRVPASITTLQSGAFDDCGDLVVLMVGAEENSANIVLWDSGWNALTSDFSRIVYYGVSADEYIKESNVIYLQTATGVATAISCVGSGAITIKDSVTINATACTVTTIAKYSFYMSDATSVTIESGVTTIEENAFNQSTSLVSISLPSSIASIGNSAFTGCTKLTSINIPEGITAIGESTFKNCTALKTIVLPVSLTSVGDSAFSSASALATIYYKGTSTQYNAITVSETDNASFIASSLSVLYYSETQPTEDYDSYWHYTDTAMTVVAVWTAPDDGE